MIDRKKIGLHLQFLALSFLVACVSLTSIRFPSKNPAFEGTGPFIVGYAPLWDDHLSLAEASRMVDVMNVAFFKPDQPDSGQNFSKTIDSIKHDHPSLKVLASIGGYSYRSNWSEFDAAKIRDFVIKNHFDGVDIDYEPDQPGCHFDRKSSFCDSDEKFISILKRTRKALPKPFLVTAALWGDGAYGVGEFKKSLPLTVYRGVAVNVLKSVGGDLDMVNLMSYEMPQPYNPEEAFSAYRSLYNGPLALGFQVTKEGKGHVLNAEEVLSHTQFVKKDPKGGVMLWHLMKVQKDKTPSTPQVIRTVCEVLERCEHP